jgi:glycosyltransferase involved in cell wall biosynthesis
MMAKANIDQLKIGLVSMTDPRIGGGRSYEELLLSQLVRDLNWKYSFTLFVPKHEGADSRVGREIHITTSGYRSGSWARFLQALRGNPFVFRIMEKICFSSSHLEKVMLQSGIDLAYFMSPNPLASGMSRIPMITTIWDLAHVTNPEFPEVSSRRRLEYRDLVYGIAARKSTAVVVDSVQGANDVAQSYGLSSSRLVPLAFWNLVETWGVPSDPSGDFVIYPAQFWPHKNHVVLLKAASLLRESDRPVPRLLFVGGDRGNRGYVESLAHDLGVNEYVTFTGFVPDAELKSLMLQSLGLVMPTYFGPTNLPPLEALKSGIPVAVSTCDALSLQADGQAIQAIEPDDVNGWAEALERFVRLDVPRPAEVSNWTSITKSASSTLDTVFSNFVTKRSTWAPGKQVW